MIKQEKLEKSGVLKNCDLVRTLTAGYGLKGTHIANGQEAKVGKLKYSPTPNYEYLMAPDEADTQRNLHDPHQLHPPISYFRKQEVRYTIKYFIIFQREILETLLATFLSTRCWPDV